MSVTNRLHTVTGATGYTGRYIAKLLLEEGHRVQSITGHPERANPFGDRVPLHPFNFDRPDLLEETLRGTDTLFNTYWIRVNHGAAPTSNALNRPGPCSKPPGPPGPPGVRRIVHISV